MMPNIYKLLNSFTIPTFLKSEKLSIYYWSWLKGYNIYTLNE